MKFSVDDIYLNKHLYDVETFHIFNKHDNIYRLNLNEFRRIFYYLGFKPNDPLTKTRLHSYCLECKENRPFICEIYMTGEIKILNIPNTVDSFTIFYDDITKKILLLNQVTNKDEFSKKDFYEKNQQVLQFVFFCTDNLEHQYTMHLLITFDPLDEPCLKICKIGQYPNLNKIINKQNTQYENVMEMFGVTDDIFNANISFSRSLYVGGFTYLRRAFNKIIDYYITSNKIVVDSNHQEDRNNATRSCFHKDLQPFLNAIYLILSHGIHTLSEEECKKYFCTLLPAIHIQLEYEQSKIQETNNKKEITAELQRIQNNLQSKDI